MCKGSDAGRKSRAGHFTRRASAKCRRADRRQSVVVTLLLSPSVARRVRGYKLWPLATATPSASLHSLTRISLHQLPKDTLSCGGRLLGVAAAREHRLVLSQCTGARTE